MNISLTSYRDVLPPGLLLFASRKMLVRDSKRVGRGTFVARVEGFQHSCDVSVHLDEQGTVTSHKCSCRKPDFCPHKVTLLHHITEQKKFYAGNSLRAMNKLAKQQYLRDAAEERAGSIHAEPSIPLSSMHTETLKIVREVLRNEGMVTQRAKMAIVKRWKKLHLDRLVAFRHHLTDERAFAGFHEVVQACLNACEKYKDLQRMLLNYLRENLNELHERINMMASLNDQLTVYRYFASQVYDPGKSSICEVYTELLLPVCENRENNKQLRMELCRSLLQYADPILQQMPALKGGVDFGLRLFERMLADPCASDYFIRFKPFPHSGHHYYNIQLIEGLIRAQQWQLAAAYAWQLALFFPLGKGRIYYYQLLKLLYLEKPADASDTLKLVYVLRELVLHTYNRTDYHWVVAHFQTRQDRVQWAARVMAHAHANMHGHDMSKIEFPFLICEDERDYRKMITMINAYTPNRIIVRYFHRMAAANKARLLTALLVRTNPEVPWLPSVTDAQLEEAGLLQLLSLLLDYFTPNEIRQRMEEIAIRVWRFSPNAFFVYLAGKLVE